MLLVAGLLTLPGLALPGSALAIDDVVTPPTLTTGMVIAPNELVRPTNLMAAPAGHRLTPNQVIGIAEAIPKIKAEVKRRTGSYPVAYLNGPTDWQVSWYTTTDGEVAQVQIQDATGAVTGAWTGFQVAWSMARGYPGAFGRHVNALYVWIPLCFVFALPFIQWRRPLSIVNLDLIALLAFSISLAFFNHANIGISVPLVYPPLVYLLLRMVSISGLGRRRRAAKDPGPLRLLVPVSWLAIGVVFLLGFRIALNVEDSNVIDVGYAGVIGGEKVAHGQALYGAFPSDNQHGDTYGPANYEAYVIPDKILGWSGTWDSLPAAHLASVIFDLLCVLFVFLLGRRVRGPTLGVVLAYAWVAYPFTLFSLESNTNDSLVGALVLAAIYAATFTGRRAGGARFLRGASVALAGLTKFAPLALAPLMASHNGDLRRPRRLLVFAAGFVIIGGLAFIPAVTHDSLSTIWNRTVTFQDQRGSPFSLWGLYGSLKGVQTTLEQVGQVIVQAGAVVLALMYAFLPRRKDVIGLAAGAAAILITLQLGITHWFYLYLPWFFGPAVLALLGRFTEPAAAPEASESARSPVLAVA
jgi:hypothetical protein